MRRPAVRAALRLRWLALALALLALGSATAGSTRAQAAGPKYTAPAVAHYPGGVRVQKEEWELPLVQEFGTGQTGAGEPTIGIDRNGIVYADNFTKVVKSSDQGATWQNVSPPNHATSLDPYLYLDPSTGRVFKSDLLGTCQAVSYTDNGGSSWTLTPSACNLSDHQTIAAGPPVSSPTQGYANVVYNCSQSFGYNGFSAGSVCDKSLDGGRTWVPTGTPAFNDPSPYGFGDESGDSGVPAHCNGDIGHIFVGADGTLYVPRGWCGQPWLAVSRDEGATWTRTQVGTNGMNTTVDGGFGVVAPGHGQSDHEAAVVADAHGVISYLWMALDRLPYLSVSRDGGATWGAPMMVGAPGVTEAWGPALGMDAAGRVSIAYMGTTTSPGAPWTGSYAATTWTGYLGIIEHPTDARPLIFSAAVSAPAKPLVRGTCGPDRCNNTVLDFIDVQGGPDGSAWGAFVDSTKSAELVIARLFPPPPPAEE